MSNLGQLFDEDGSGGDYTIKNLTKAPGEQLYPKINFWKDSRQEKRAKKRLREAAIEQYMKDNPVAQTQYPEITIDSSALRYPSNPPIRDQSDYVVFKFYKYQPPWGRSFHDQGDYVGEGGARSMDAKNMSGVWFDKNKYVEQSGFWSDEKSFKQAWAEHVEKGKSVLNVYNRADQYTETPDPIVMLYMPDDIQDAYKADWEGKAFGSITAGILASAGREGVGSKLKTALQNAKGTAARLPVNAAAGIITNLAKGITGDQINASDVFGGISGVIKNPNV